MITRLHLDEDGHRGAEGGRLRLHLEALRRGGDSSTSSARRSSASRLADENRRAAGAEIRGAPALEDTHRRHAREDARRSSDTDRAGSAGRRPPS
ncbi:MAG: hypothetical protein M0C28_16160 [Candidatus Moduliflexus flocculans]|nr:hypothetical protein [Candidatus Moduliflexus flocculans]